ncbi:MAG: hypothetical protein R3Y47_10800 [Lachnospiraceae bacterium]
MDNFMDKISQKVTASDFIKANTTAEAELSQVYQQQVQEYDKLIQEIKAMQKHNLQESEAIEVLCKQMDEHLSSLEELLQKTSQEIEKNQEFTHSEGVKVYRNVQAVVEKQSDKIQECVVQALEKNKQEIGAASRKSLISVKIVAILIMIITGLNFAFDIVQYLGIL